MEQSRLSLLSSIWKNNVVRYGSLVIAAIAFWDTLTNQFGWPKIPTVWDMTGALLPIWTWVIILFALFVFGLFEYVRSNVPNLQSYSVNSPQSGKTFYDRYAEIEEGEVAVDPDIDLRTVGERVANQIDVALQGKDLWRRVNLTIADEAVKRNLTVSGRFGDFASKIFEQHRLRNAIFDYRANSIKIPDHFHANQYTDIKMVSAEVDEIWPPETNALAMGEVGEE